MDAEPVAVAEVVGRHRRDWFFGHPGGLATLSFTEAWVGFSYYGMLSILTLYMTRFILLPEHVGHVIFFPAFHSFLDWLYGHRGTATAIATAITGLYSALAYGMPLIGGLIADYWLGRTRTIILGAVLMTTGHFLMAFDASFLIALALIIAGMGCGGTMKAQVGGLYAIDDTRRADAFQLYTIGLNIAVIIAPIVCGFLGEDYRWSWGFGAAGVGMCIGLAVYLAGRGGLPPEPPRKRRGGPAVHDRVTATEWKRVAVLVALLPVLAVAALANQEIFNGYMIWADKYYDLKFFGIAIPVATMMSFDAVISTITLIGSMAFWRWYAARRRDPDEIVKITFGVCVSALGPLVLALASWQAAVTGHKVGLGYALGFHTLNDIGFSNTYAIGMALYSRAAPKAMGATVVNGYVLHISIANILVGYLGGFLGQMPEVQFWLLHSALIAAAAIVLFVFARVFGTLLAPRAEV